MGILTAKKIFLEAVASLAMAGFVGFPSAQGGAAVSPFSPTVIAGPILTVNYEITNHHAPTITGSINSPSAGVYVMINKQTYQGVNNGDGSWAAGVSNSLPDGIYNVAVAAVVTGGGQVVTSVPKCLIIDTVAPKITVDNSPNAGAVLSGRVDDPTTQVMVTVGGNNYTVAVASNDAWRLAPADLVPVLSPGTYTASVVAGDMAGNISQTVAVKLIITDSNSTNPSPPPQGKKKQPSSSNQNSPSGKTDQAPGRSMTSVI